MTPQHCHVFSKNFKQSYNILIMSACPRLCLVKELSVHRSLKSLAAVFPVSLLVGFVLFLVQLTGAHVCVQSFSCGMQQEPY